MNQEIRLVGAKHGAAGAGGVKYRASEGQQILLLLAQPQHIEHRGGNVSLLADGLGVNWRELLAGVEEQQRRFLVAERVLVARPVGLRSVVGGENEQGVCVPGLAAGGLEEAAERQIGIGNGGVNRQRALGKFAPVRPRYRERVVGAEREQRGKKRLRRNRKLLAKILKIRLVEDAPVAVVVGAFGAAGVLVEAVVVLHPDDAGEHIEAHRAVGGAVVHGRGVAVAAQHVAQSVDFIGLEVAGNEGRIH